MAETKPNPILKLVLELGPVAVFFLSYRYFREDTITLMGTEYSGIVMATILFVPAILVSLVASRVLLGDLPKMAVVTAVVVVVFGGLTIALNDDTFIKMKPTIVNGIFAAILGFGLLQGRSFLKYLMGEMMPLTDEGWMMFTRAWVGFFIGMALMNEAVWRTQTEEFWVNFKTFGSPILTLIFMATQFPKLQRHMINEED